MIKCPLCNEEFSDMESLEKHLLDYHYLTFQEYYEMKDDLSSFQGIPMTYILNSEGYTVPEWSKLKKNYEINQAKRTIKEEIKEYYGKIISDRFFQLFLIDDIYFSNTLPHCYEGFKDILKAIQKKEKRDRNKVWFLDWFPGYPRIISPENMNGLRTVQIDSLYKIKSELRKITVNDYRLDFPEMIPFDRAHHSRYNLLNPSPDRRKTKRLKLKMREGVLNCVKFYGDTDCRSIFNLEGKDSITNQDLLVVKLVLLRNKSFIRLIFDILEELSGDVGVLSDQVFLRNTVVVDPGNKIKVHLSWLPEDEKEGYINISIL